MYSFILYSDEAAGRRGRKAAAAVEPARILRTNCLLMKIPVFTGRGERKSLRAAVSGAQALRSMGVRRVVLQNGFPYPEAFSGLETVTGSRLLSAAAGAVTRALLSRQEESALLCAGYLDGRAEELLRCMALCRRRVCLVTSRGRYAGLEKLQRRLGVSLVESPGSGQLSGKGTAVFLSPPPYPLRLPPDWTALCTGSYPAVTGCRFVTEVEYDLPGDCVPPPGFDRNAAVAAALCAGGLREEDIRVTRVAAAGAP